MVIDGHCHVGAGDGFTGPWDTRACLEHYRPRARAAGIHKTVIFAAFNSDYTVANRKIGELALREKGRFLPFLFLHSGRNQGQIASLVRRAVAQGPFLGIKVHRHDAPITREICEAADAFRLPILYDVMGEVHPMSLLAREYPNVPFIIPHLGSFADDWRAHETTIDLISRFPNLYTDTSGVRRFDYLSEAVRRGGAHKVIFGSDGPFLHPRLELDKIRLLKLPAHDEGQVLGGNMRRLLLAVGKKPRCHARCSCRVCRFK